MTENENPNSNAANLSSGDLYVGIQASVTMNITESVIDSFAKFSGDFNPLHCDKDFAYSLGFRERVAHGAIQQALVSRLVGMCIPGRRSLIKKLSTQYLSPVFSGDQITAHGTLASWDTINQNGHVVIGVKAPDGRTCSITHLDFTLTLAGQGVTRSENLSPNETSKIIRNPGINRNILVIGSRSGLYRSIRKTLVDNDYVPISIGRGDADYARNIVEMSDGEWADILCETNPFGVVHCASMQPVKATMVDMDIGIMLRNMHLLTNPLRAIAKTKMSFENSGLRRIIAITSSGARHIFPENGYESYGYSKTIQSFFIRDLAREIASTGATVNAIAPSEIGVGMNVNMSQRSRALLESRMPSHKLTTPEDVAQTLLFLLSHAGDSITGQEIVLAGGRSK